jgi:hypothetical protein
MNKYTKIIWNIEGLDEGFEIFEFDMNLRMMDINDPVNYDFALFGS